MNGSTCGTGAIDRLTQGKGSQATWGVRFLAIEGSPLHFVPVTSRPGFPSAAIHAVGRSCRLHEHKERVPIVGTSTPSIVRCSLARVKIHGLAFMLSSHKCFNQTAFVGSASLR